MRRLLLIPVCFVALLVPVAVLAGGGEGFDGVVRTIETRYHVHATRVLRQRKVAPMPARNGRMKEFHETFWDAMFDVGDGNHINRPEILQPVLERHLGLPRRITP